MFVKKMTIRYDLAKDQSELTWGDFEQFPVWVNCLELEDIGGETMFAPIDPPLCLLLLTLPFSSQWMQV